MNEKISILIITRNREKKLTGCLESLVKQTKLPDEVIVVDNASADNTKKVALSFKKKLPIIYSYEKQIGMPHARNNGIKKTTGTLLLMLDDDCEADKFWVERMERSHQKYPNAWVIQGRTYSLPKNKLYSLLADFNRFISVQNHAKIKSPLKMQSFFSRQFRNDVQFLTCNTQNLSIKVSFLKKYKLSFDERFYRGADTDFARLILQKNGLIIFCSSVTVGHWERPNLAQFLKQRWHFGRNAYRITNKWKTPITLNIKSIIPTPRILFNLYLFCKVINQLHKFPALAVLFFLVRLYRLNGYFYEKRILSLEKQ
jgi:glycosyltransferase involved in cell wall biosynthesis